MTVLVDVLAVIGGLAVAGLLLLGAWVLLVEARRRKAARRSGGPDPREEDQR